MKTKLSKARIKLPEHLQEFEGDLYDNRKVGFDNQRIRKRYVWHYHHIKTVAELKATLRAGGFAWPGGYPLYFVTADCQALSFEAAFAEYRQLVAAFKDRWDMQWRVLGCEINWEDPDMVCCHTGKLIESAYGEPSVDIDPHRMAEETNPTPYVRPSEAKL
jgi:hypothetical protein